MVPSDEKRRIPIRIDDAVVVENEWGWIEEITATYVVIKLGDWRRLIVPLSYFMDKPFQNWTRETLALIGTVMVYTDHTVRVERVRQRVYEIARASRLWDGAVVNLQVTDAKGCAFLSAPAPRRRSSTCAARCARR